MKKLLLVMLLLFGTCSVVFAEDAGESSYDAKAARAVAKQAVSLLEAGNPKDAYNFLRVYYEQYKEDNDINFLLGQSCNMLGKPAEAIEYYQKILRKDPQLPRVRLELGRAYAASGKRTEARQEFNTVLASSPPPVVAQHIEKFLAQMEAQKDLNIRLSLGYLFDSNVNAGPDGQIVSNGWQYNGVKRSDHALTTALQIDQFRETGTDSAWQTGLQYSRTDYRNATDLSWDELNIYSGPLKRVGDVTYSLPVNVRLTNVGGSRFSYVYGITPQVQYKLSGNKELFLSMNAQSREYFTNDYRNGESWAFNIAERFNFNQERNRFIEIGVGIGKEQARDLSFSNNNSNLYVTYYTPLSNGLWLLLRPSVTWTRYKGDDGFTQLVGAPAARNESQYGLQINLIKTQGSWNYTFGYSYTRNRSNIDIYTYNRSLISIQASRYF